jgi:hypothetical protein
VGGIADAIQSVGPLLIIGTLMAGVALSVAGRISNRPFWKTGVRLQAAALMLAPLVGGLVILAASLRQVDWWSVLLIAPVGVFGIIVGVLRLRWVARQEIPDAGEATHIR